MYKQLPKEPVKLGIISALQEEQHGLIEVMQNQQTSKRGMRDYVAGNLWGINSVCVLSRIGKVAAAITATSLIENFGVTHLIFTGVAGGAGNDVKVGDIVIAKNLIQHDLDCSPLYPRFEVPLTGRALLESDAQLSDIVWQAAGQFLEHDFTHHINQPNRDKLGLHKPKRHHGLIASGDQFIHQPNHMQQIKNALPALLAVEMEGAAVAQVCAEFTIPFAVVRTISDAGDGSAPVDFLNFIQAVASPYAFHIIRHTCSTLAALPGSNQQQI
jgi:adenosylhomocysteine nucleosidase